MGRPGNLGVRSGLNGNAQISLNNLYAESLAIELAEKMNLIASGSIELMNPNDNYLKYISKRKDVDVDGFVDIIAHGDSDTIMVGSKMIRIDYKDAAKLIRSKMGKKIKGIRLLSCNTGSKPDGFEQKLANKLHVPVMAPTKYSFSYPNGKHFVAGKEDYGKSPDYKDIGEFKIFYPRRNK